MKLLKEYPSRCVQFGRAYDSDGFPFEVHRTYDFKLHREYSLAAFEIAPNEVVTPEGLKFHLDWCSSDSWGGAAQYTAYLDSEHIPV